MPIRPASELPQSLPEAAQFWYRLGYQLIPIVPTEKRPSVRFEPWLSTLSPESISDHWKTRPSDELAIVCGESIVVFDTDTEESEANLLALEERLSLPPALKVRTKKGVHHYFRVPSGVKGLKAAGFGTSSPGKIDVRFGVHSIAVTAPSRDKSIDSDHVCGPEDLTEVTQSFIDAVNDLNGVHHYEATSRPTPRSEPKTDSVSIVTVYPMDEDLILDRLRSILELIHPDTSPEIEAGRGGRGVYDRWISCLAGIFNCTMGSDQGFELADAWCAKGDLYMGTEDIRKRWKSFRTDYGQSAGFPQLLKEVLQVKPDWREMRSELEDPFTVEQWEIIPSSAHERVEPNQRRALSSTQATKDLEDTFDLPADHFLLKHSAVHHLDEMRRNASPTNSLLFPIVNNGEFTVIYAAPNAGKTLLTLFLVRQGIIEKRFSARQIFHLNFDDSSEGARLKTELAQSYGFNAIVPGYAGASVQSVKEWMEQMIEDGSAKGVVLIFDTMKKFADPMQKSEISEFTSLCRRFTMKGGTVVALAHTNKKRDESGKPIPGGTSDVIDDCDCAWILVSSDDGNSFRKAIFNRQKQRSNVPATAAFRYDGGSNLDYLQRLDTVEYVGDHTETDEDFVKTSFTHKRSSSGGQTQIDVVKDIIKATDGTKGAVLAEMHKRLELSRGKAETLLNQHTGDDPTKAHWNFRKGKNNASMYYLLEDNSLDL